MTAPLRLAIAYDCLFPLTTGGGERQYRAMSEELVKRGHQVDYLTALQWDREPETPFTLSPVTGRLRLYDDAGVRSSLAAARFAAGLLGSLVRRRGRYDAVIVSGLPILNVFAARLALLGSGTQVVVDYLEVWGRAQWVEYAGRPTGTLAWLLQRAAIRITPLATCHSRLSANRLRQEGLRSTPLVSPGLIDQVDDVPLRADPADPPYVLYVGRHIPDKRVEDLPAAVAQARHAVPGLELVLLGSGPTTRAVRAAVEALGSPRWITMPGFVSQERLDELMAGAACLANPSRREGYGLVVVEAAAHGTPVVVVDHPGNASVELIDPGVNGFVAESGAPTAFGDAIAAAVRGGRELRVATRGWFDDAVTTRTIERTVGAIVEAIQARR
ncbi:glycosyltransferase family 4 protein [Demequina capsici]|uniref:D-inositol 3-phosphate glycosyltransferase n=1 Tax=Demequina capsici TaxID=3075620 RepID=A0AA96JD39_9MICO|nr:glycosyltransferase family 4 protein [Demequina sp. PMTSA13]WNM27646.1 glycosyltransferase family 4 protein [Demequina sp. PMTSA13]